jgi:hypothetical protein
MPVKQLTKKLDRLLAAYAVAAAGISLAGPSAQAQVVYTPTDLKLSHGALTFDIDANGTSDFSLANDETSSFYFVGGILFVTGNQTEANAIIGHTGKQTYEAVPVPQGVSIGSNSPGSFLVANHSHAPFMAEAASSYFGTVLSGPFANTTNKYMGMRFTDNGAVHYGWMRLTVTADPQRFPAVIVKVSGYAYEATPDTAIIAGDRGHSSAQSPHVQQSGATLGQLSLGAAGRK